MRSHANGLRGIIGLALATLIAMAVGVQAAHAGTWMQVSCINPDGSAAPSEGWTQSTSGPADPGGIASTQCSPGTPMVAELSLLAGAPAGSTELLTYQPPAGSTLFGGSVDVNMSADGYGPGTGQPNAAAASQLFEPSVSNVFFQCVAFFQTCGAGSPDFSGTVSLPNDAQGSLIAAATCSSQVAGAACDTNAKNNAWALTQVLWAHLLLSSSVSPTASGFSGSALQPNVRGTGHVILTAAEAAGPGIYADSIAIDGQTVSSGTPNANGGKCVPVGTDPGSGALMFDYQQPCLTSEMIDAPVPTQGVPDGSHELAVTVTDAAGNTSPVLDQTITTSNPVTTPAPSARRTPHARFVISWRWHGATTVLRSIRVQHLTRRARVAVRCVGRHCPRIRAHATGPRKVRALLRRLAGRHLQAGQSLLLTVTAPHLRPERIRLQMRDGHVPLAKLLH
ncbi:MAG: hypothetical protein ACRDPM_01585 [Solirubrobacteraceae bacterium]